MTERTDSTVSESTLHEADNEEYYDSKNFCYLFFILHGCFWDF